MNRRVLKYGILAALFSAAFFIGENPVDAYTYSGAALTSDSLNYDSDDLIVTNKSQLNISGDIIPIKLITQKIAKQNITGFDLYMKEDSNPTMNPYGSSNIMIVKLTNVPSVMSNSMYDEFLNILNNSKNMNNFNVKYGTTIKFEGIADIDTTDSGKLTFWDWFKKGISLKDGSLQYDERWIEHSQQAPYWVYRGKQNSSTKITYFDYIDTNENAAITISNNSTLNTKGNIQTTAAINVLDNSFLSAAGSIIGGNIVSSNFIKTEGLAKSNVLNVAAINAASASITGNQSISGVFTATGQAKLNGGATLGNKKVTGLSAGTLSATSTEAVNGSQLNTIKQKLASAGKTYSAGADVAISSANAISIAKKGVVDKGDIGIVTGGTVYKITSALNSSLDTLKASVSAHQSTLTTLTQGLSDLKASVTNINQSVASATKSLSSQLNNRLQSDMGNLSDNGKNDIRSMVSSTLKSMNSMNISDGDQSAVATYEAQEKAPGYTASQVTKEDTTAIQNELNTKANTAELTSLNEVVSGNTKQLTANTNSIQVNKASIANQKETKADVTGSNIEVGKYAKKLGTGKVEAGNKELVTGDTIHTALGQKADVSYVDSGLGMMSSHLDAMSQGLTRDMNRMGAGAAALAGLQPTSYDAADKLSFAYGGGHYKNADTSALGAFYHPNDKTMVSVAGTIGNADAMVSAGVSIKLGLNHDVKQVMITPKMFSAQEVTNQGMKDQLDSQSEQLK